MEYLIIILAVVCFTGQFAFTKIFEKSIRQTLITTLSLLVFTSIVGVVIFLLASGFKIEITIFSLIMSVVFALIMIPYFITGIKVLSLGSLAIYSMFMMLGGMLLPFFYGTFFLSESVTYGKIFGCIILCVSMILQAFSQKDSEKNKSTNSTKNRVWYFVLCMLGFITNGLTGVVAKAHQINENAVNEESFSVISCFMTAVLSILLLVVLLFSKKNKQKLSEFKSTLKTKPLFIMTCVGFAAYMGNYLHLIAAISVPASVQFPIVSGGVIVFSALTSFLIFKESISKKEWISILCAFISTFLFAF